MELFCTNCHAEIAAGRKADWCPSCGGALAERAGLARSEEISLPLEIDHRGIVMPRRHAVGGIITPQ